MNALKLLSKWSLGLLLFGFGLSSYANNIQITGTSVSGSNITFNISWENSWNTNVAPANYDAVWVFVKYQDCNTRLWSHASLSLLSADHSAASPLQVDPVTDGKGVFVRRSAMGGGNIASTSVTLKMTIPVGTYNYKVFGIEMVNVPQGSFKIGDSTIPSAFNELDVNNDNAISAANLGGVPASANVPLAYPVGYNSFYCMKYEISQEQYVDFLNSLTYNQQKTHTVTDPISESGTYAMSATYLNRNGIMIITSGSNSTIPAVYACDATGGVENNINDGQNTAMNMMNWNDMSAYLDWAALRPMTELEYEKTCRGVNQPRIAGEYPWGTTDINFASTTNLTNPLKPNEGYSVIVNGLCNVSVLTGYYESGVGVPLRVGFSATGTSGRASAAAAFYGAMQMGGNISEVVVNTTTEGVTFSGVLGDGELLPNGDSNVLNWPSAASTGIGKRGGSFSQNNGVYYGNGYEYVKTSNRNFSNTNTGLRTADYGGRGVR